MPSVPDGDQYSVKYRAREGDGEGVVTGGRLVEPFPTRAVG